MSISRGAQMGEEVGSPDIVVAALCAGKRETV
jgi:hypothetical protein